MLSLFLVGSLPPIVSGCGGAAAVAVVPFITFAFEGVMVVNAAGDLQIVQVALDNNATQQGKSSGTFDSPTLSTSDTQGIQLQAFGPPPAKPISGSFDGGSLSLTLPGAVPPLATAYSGEFIQADTILLTPSSGGLPTIKLLRVDNSFRPSLDGSKWTGKNGKGDPWTISVTTQQVGLAAEVLTATTDVLAGQAGTWTGFAEMRDLEVTITRGANVTRLSGIFGPAGTTPPGSTQFNAQTLNFPDGSVLTRNTP